MLMTKTLVLGIGLAIIACVFSGAAMQADTLFSESFDDAHLTKRDWYDGTEFRIVGGSWDGQGCIEFEWRDGGSQPLPSSGARHSFETTDEITLGILDPATAQRLDAVFERYAPRCSEVRLQEWQQRGAWHKLKDNAFYLLNEVL